MSFINVIKEKLESLQIYNGMSGKWESRFVVDGVEYTLLANSIAGNGSEDFNTWMLEFENSISHRIGMGDSNSKIGPAFAEAVNTFIKEKNPFSFFTYGSSIQPIKSILENLKKKIKKYNLIDDTADKKNEETKEIIPGNEIGKITWTKMAPQEVVDTEDRDSIVSDKLETEYELPKDIKPNKEYMSGTSKTDKLDKGDKAYDVKTESVIRDIPTKHQLKIALDTLKLSKVGAKIMGGMSHQEAIKFLLSHGYTQEKINKMLQQAGHDIKDFVNTESVDVVQTYVQKFKDKMKGTSRKTACGWVDGVKGISKEDKIKIKKKLGLLNKEESFAEFKSRKLNEEYFDEGKGMDILKGAARSALKRISEKMKEVVEKVYSITGNKEQLLNWLEDNKDDFIHAMDIARHMMNKKQLTFEEEILSGELLKENILDLIAKKSPKTLIATTMILMIMGSGHHVFAKNDSGEEALKKAKKSVEQIVDIVKEQGGKAGKHIQKGAEKVGRVAKKGAEEVGKEIRKKVEKKSDEIGSDIKKGAEELEDTAKEKAEQIKQGFQNFIQKKNDNKEEKKPEIKKGIYGRDVV